jgi:hypothetical protein
MVIEARSDLQERPGIVLLVLVVLLLVTVLSIRGTRWWAVALILLSLSWLVINKPLEGPILLYINRWHGLTLADLVSFVGIAVAIARVALGAGHPSRAEREPPDWSVLGPMTPYGSSRRTPVSPESEPMDRGGRHGSVPVHPRG